MIAVFRNEVGFPCPTRSSSLPFPRRLEEICYYLLLIPISCTPGDSTSLCRHYPGLENSFDVWQVLRKDAIWMLRVPWWPQRAWAKDRASKRSNHTLPFLTHESPGITSSCNKCMPLDTNAYFIRSPPPLPLSKQCTSQDNANFNARHTSKCRLIVPYPPPPPQPDPFLSPFLPPIPPCQEVFYLCPPPCQKVNVLTNLQANGSVLSSQDRTISLPRTTSEGPTNHNSLDLQNTSPKSMITHQVAHLMHARLCPSSVYFMIVVLVAVCWSLALL